jgi:hypothetical protein
MLFILGPLEISIALLQAQLSLHSKVVLLILPGISMFFLFLNKSALRLS